ncbi:MAG: serine hydroxymethyltransferase [Hyphomicrobiales bacterium]
MSEATFYLEFLSIGGQVKVMAIDPETGIEVSIIAPESASQAEMTNVAVEKLKRRIAKEAEQEAGKAAKRPNRDTGRGILV